MGRCIAITGAGSGLGRSLARRLGSDGDTIVLLGRTRAPLEAVAAELGGDSYPVVCDVASADSVRTAFAAIAERHPGVDVLINNAAVYQPFFVKDATDAQIGAAVMTNFAGPIYCSRAVIPMMQKGGHIINISSETVGLPHAMFSLYQSSKAGLERFTEALHAELEPHGIRVTLVRAGQMMDADSKSPAAGELARRFAEENLKRGLDLRARPISSFTSVADVVRMLIHLPGDVNVPQLFLEARHP
jgi:meso-butanediol dehydrogenase / (S,S)-butanediol dehydrogenase / diacetyl reductase